MANSSASADSLPRRTAGRRLLLLVLLCAAGFGLFMVVHVLLSRPDAVTAVPRITRLDASSELLTELLGFDEAHVYEFSGTRLEVWLEATVDQPGKEPVTYKGAPAAAAHDEWGTGERPTAANLRGRFAVWGGETSEARELLNLALQVGIVDETGTDAGIVSAMTASGQMQSQTHSPSLVVPRPEGLPKQRRSGQLRSPLSGRGYSLPDPLPPVGEAFPVFGFRVSDFYAESEDELIDPQRRPDLTVTVKCMARRLPFELSAAAHAWIWRCY